MGTGIQPALFGRLSHPGRTGAGRTWTRTHGRDSANGGNPAFDGKSGRHGLRASHIANPNELPTEIVLQDCSELLLSEAGSGFSLCHFDPPAVPTHCAGVSSN